MDRASTWVSERDLKIYPLLRLAAHEPGKVGTRGCAAWMGPDMGSEAVDDCLLGNANNAETVRTTVQYNAIFVTETDIPGM